MVVVVVVFVVVGCCSSCREDDSRGSQVQLLDPQNHVVLNNNFDLDSK